MTREEIITKYNNAFDFKGQTITDVDLSYTNFSAVKFRQGVFVNVNLLEAEWSDGDIGRARFERCMMRRSELKGNQFRTSKFIKCVLDDGSLAGSDLEGSSFENCSAQGIDLTNCNLGQVQIIKSNFEMAVFRGAKTIGANFSKSLFSGSDFNGCDLSNANFSFAHLRKARMENLDLRTSNFEGAHLDYAVLKGSNLEGCDLRSTNFEGTDFIDAKLRKANFAKANLHGAKFRSADLSEANLEGANLSQAYLKGMLFSATNLKGTNLEEAFLEKAVLRDVDISGGSLVNASLRDAKLTNVKLLGTDLRGAVFLDATLNQINLMGARHIFLAEWSPKALQMFTNPKIREMILKDFMGYLGRLEVARRKDQLDVVAAYVQDFEKIYGSMDSIIDPPLILDELRKLGAYFIERIKGFKQSGDPLEVEDSSRRLREVETCYERMTGEALEVKATAPHEKALLTLGLGENIDLLPNFLQCLNAFSEAYNAAFKDTGGEGFEGMSFNLDSLLHQALKVTKISSQPWEIELEGEMTGLMAVANLVLKTGTLLVGNDLAKAQQEAEYNTSHLEKLQASGAKDEETRNRIKIIQEKVGLLKNKISIHDVAMRQLFQAVKTLGKKPLDLGLLHPNQWAQVEGLEKESWFQESIAKLSSFKLGQLVRLSSGDIQVVDLEVHLPS